MKRRTILKTALLSVLMCTSMWASQASADDKAVSLALPFDVESWDPTARVIPQATSLYKTVFDQPLEYDADNKLQPGVVKEYNWIGDDGLTLELILRDDVYFHNGDKLTSEDIKFTFMDHPKSDKSIQLGYIWWMVTAIDTPEPTKAVFHFSQPFVTAPEYLGFASSFILPKKYIEKVGMEEFLKNPVGSGPYKLVSYQRNSRMVLEAFDKYWGGVPEIKKLTIQVIPTSTSRVSAVQSGQVDLAYALPIREAVRLDKLPQVTSSLTSTVDTYLIHMVNKGALKDKNVRLAMHYAINKSAISRALLNGLAEPLSTANPPGTPAYDADYEFDYSPEKAKEYLAKSGYSVDNPVTFKFLATNGVHPMDNQMARAIVQMWKKVGINAELETIDFGKYFQEVAAGTLDGPALWLWNNSTGDPELYTGSYLNADTMFSVWRSEEVMKKLRPLLAQTDYDKRMEEYKEFNRWVVEQGFTIPLMEGVSSVAHDKDLNYVPYRNGWILPAKW
ncbi:MAG: hypothetical protein CMI02_13670 [Oceanospirillaceae bacterium]|nr:hypothetical protein [Oceanospirillaceae bacterium]MBT13071.1 hypothetical protein [Oceanospirillaceae bacterium]|tara:strand:+ start:37735 stop:39246 length:1512 start_codon:yes stop_codon:yes gene_type:complete